MRFSIAGGCAARNAFMAKHQRELIDSLRIPVLEPRPEPLSAGLASAALGGAAIA